MLAGDSAGAHTAAQTAMAFTDPAYARAAGLPTTLGVVDVRATVLVCGAYDLGLPDYSGPYARFLHAVLWAYAGVKNFRDDPRAAFASLPEHVGPDFPPAFLTVGNADPLQRHSHVMAAALTAQGVPVDFLCFPDDHQPALGHEYQFDLTTAAGTHALARTLAHLENHTTRTAGVDQAAG